MKEYRCEITCDGAKIKRKSTVANGGNVPRLGST
jgi:hypothetical protein